MVNVKEQYEAYPYPERKPADEDKRMITGTPSSVAEINHYLFAGARDWSKPFKALVAGGGTGDGLIMLAQQLADVGCPAEITYVDLSTASREIAEARAARRGLINIRFETGSLLDAGSLGKFDYIDCCGVLHHLPDPDAGFAALRSALAPGGGMGLMVYGALGRRGVYDVQDMLKALQKDGEQPSALVETAQTLLGVLPDSNGFTRNPYMNDHLIDPAGLFDLLLHSQDRAYLVPEIYDTLERADLDLVSFVAPINYDVDLLITDAKLKARLSRLDRPAREGFAELFTGNLRKHVFYVKAKGEASDTIAEFGEGMIPILQEMNVAGVAKLAGSGKPLTGRREGLKVERPLSPIVAHVLPLIDGKRSFEDIRQAIKPLPRREGFYESIKDAYRTFNGLNFMLLKAGKKAATRVES